MTLDLIKSGVNNKQTWDTVLTFLYFINFFIIEVIASCFLLLLIALDPMWLLKYVI